MAGYRTEEEERGASMESATPVPSPQNRRRMGRGVRKRKRDEGEYGEGGEEDESGNEDGDKYSGYGDSDSDRDAEGEWDDVGDEETEKPAKNMCIHCNADEDNDPNPEYEEPLECTCGSFSHRQCDRTANDSGGVKSLYDEASGQWRCPSCAGADLQASPSTRSQSRNKESLADENSPRKNLRKRKSDELDEDDGSVSARQMKREKTTNEPSGLNGDASLVENLEEDEDAPGEPDPEALESFEIPRPSSRSSQKPESSQRPISVTYKRTPRKFTLSLTNFTPQKLAPILAASPDPEAIEPKPTQRAGLRGSADPPSLSNAELPSSTIPASYAMSIDDEKNPPYGGILNETEADTSQTLPDTRDRERFDKARELAEEERATRLQLSMLSTGEKKSSAEKTAGASKIECIHFGEYEIDTWYAAPYPEEYSRNRVLWICEFCLKYMNSEYVGWRHKMKCDAKHPPGDEVYRDGSISVFEIDGRKNPIYCQNLCLLAKLFLGSKTLYYDVEPFLFYVMTECDDKGMHFVGYFSKEKRSTSQNNLSCILTLPIHQRKGYGNLLMDFSYLLTRCEKKTGSPEKPFSDLGLVSYRNYWKLKLCYQLRNQREPLSITNISERTGMTADDIVCGLEALHALIRDPVTGTYALRLDYRAFEVEIEKWEQKGYIKLNPDALTWTPFVLGRSQAEHFNDAPPLTTIAPRPGEDEAAKNVVSIEDGLEIEADDPGAAKDLNGITDSGAVDVDMLQSASQALEDVERARGSGSHSMESTSIHKTATSGLMLGSDLPTTKKRPSPRSLKSQSPFQTINTNNNNLIPPTRFEIVPPLPGTSKKTRAGSSSAAARGRKRTSMSPATPRGNPLENSRSTTTTVRRARTKLSDTVTVNTGSSATRVTRGLSANLVDEVGGERSQRTASPATTAAESGIHPGTGRFVTSEV